MIEIEINGTKIISTGKYYDDNNKEICHGIKNGDLEAIKFAASRMASIIPDNGVIVPIPGHHGFADSTLMLANAIKSKCKVPVLDILKGPERKSNYEEKKLGHNMTPDEMGFYQNGDLPMDITPIYIDNVVDTGATARAAVNALGRGIVITFAITDNIADKVIKHLKEQFMRKRKRGLI